MKILKKIRGKVCTTLVRFPITHRWTTFWWKQCGYSIGKNTRIAQDVIFWAWHHLDTNNIVIEDNVSIGPGVMLIARTHSPSQIEKNGMVTNSIPGKIIIKSGAWIGARAVILPNVTIGERAIIGAGAVVTKNVESFTVVVGVPAKPIRKLECNYASETRNDSKIL